jgi:signal transduction histidine kinase
VAVRQDVCMMGPAGVPDKRNPIIFCLPFALRGSQVWTAVAMNVRLRSLLRPPEYKDPEQAGKARLLHAALLASLIGLLPLAFLNFQAGAHVLAAVLLSVSILSVVGIMLNHRRQLQAGASLLTAMLFVATLYAIIDGGGLYDTGILALPILITMATFFFGTRGGYASVAIICLTLLGLALAGAQGLIAGELDRPIPTTHLSVMLILLIAFAALIIVVTSAWERSVSQVRESRSRMELAFESAGLAIWDWEIPTGRLVFDGTAGRRFGWLGSTEPSYSEWLRRLHPDDRGPTEASLEEYVSGGEGTWTREYRTLGSVDDPGWRLAAGRVVERDGQGRAVRMAGVILDISDIKQAQQALMESERKYRLLAQELHDSVTQTIYSMSLTLKAVSKLLDADPSKVEALIDELRDMSADALSQMRALLHQARPPNLVQRGLVAAIQDHIEALRHRTKMDVGLGVDGDGSPSKSAELALYRVAQEALNNIVKHGNTQRAEVRVSFSDDRVKLTVRDWGAGFEPRKAALKSGKYGLDNMRARIESVGGQFILKSVMGVGTEVFAEVPLERTKDPAHE